VDLTVPGAIEFAKIDALPGPQYQSPLIDDQGFGGGKITGHDMGGRVAFHMSEIGLMGYFFLEKGFDIRGYGGIGIFIDGDSRRGMRGINQDNPVLNPLLRHVVLDLRGNIDQFDSPGTLKVYGFKFFHGIPEVKRNYNEKSMESQKKAAKYSLTSGMVFAV
jgi:hypothetical protein